DAARPFITPTEIEALTTRARDCDAATLALPVADTLRQSADGDYATGTTDRTGLWAVQTPQAFRYHVILDAHNRACEGPWTDDSGLASAAGYKVALVPGQRSNFKITSAEDLRYADQLMKGMNSMRFRTGLGFDVHAFAQIQGGPVRICG